MRYYGANATLNRNRRAPISILSGDEGASLRWQFCRIQANGSPGRDDTFYGKKQTPAMREYLEMRKAQGQGPAKPREIYDALKSGGYQFDAKDDEIALVGLRALLRTQPAVFHRLPQGTYGLTSWYPDAKRQSDDDVSEKKSARKKKAAARAGKARGFAKTIAAPKSTVADESALKLISPPAAVPTKGHKAA